MISLPVSDPRQAEPLLRAIVATSHEAVVAEDATGRIAAINQRFLELIGWTIDYSGQPLDDLVSAWVSRVAHPQALEDYFANCRSASPPDHPVELQPNPGQVVEARFLSIPGAEGTRFRVWFFQEWRNSALAWVSHEIKNPLNAVLGFSELLAEALGNETAPEPVKASLRGLRIGAKHLQSVLGDLLDLTRLESGVVEIHPEWMNLLSFLEDLDDLFRTRFRRRGLEFLIEPPTGPTMELWTDPGRLSQIMSNLLSNALRFTKRGWVALRVVQKGASWEFAVEDSGVGIPADQRQTIFEPFVQKQGQDSQHFGGTGLGLAICRTLAQSLDGRLGLESTVGSGSRFTLTFDQLQFRPEARRPADSGSSPLPKLTLLVADDERTNFLLVQGFLRGTQVSIITASDGLEAIEMWKTHHPQVVLMDLRMPSLSGLEAGRRIRAMDGNGRTRLLAMSATRMSQTEVFEGRTVWSGFLEKPFAKKDFLKFLSNHLSLVD